LVQGVSSDKGALGYFGLAYYEENKSKLKLVAIDNGKFFPLTLLLRMVSAVPIWSLFITAACRIAGDKKILLNFILIMHRHLLKR